MEHIRNIGAVGQWDTYTIKVLCSNCFRNIRVYIPQGTRVDDYIHSQTCPYCLCTIDSNYTPEVSK